VEWSPRTWETAALAVVGAALAAVAVPLEPVGRLLVGAAALLLLALAVRDLLLRPRLTADTDGVVVRRVAGRVAIPWGRVRASVRTTRRLGTTSRTLELEDVADDTVLLVLGRRDLGAAPEDVAATLLGRGSR